MDRMAPIKQEQAAATVSPSADSSLFPARLAGARHEGPPAPNLALGHFYKFVIPAQSLPTLAYVGLAQRNPTGTVTTADVGIRPAANPTYLGLVASRELSSYLNSTEPLLAFFLKFCDSLLWPAG